MFSEPTRWEALRVAACRHPRHLQGTSVQFRWAGLVKYDVEAGLCRHGRSVLPSIPIAVCRPPVGEELSTDRRGDSLQQRLQAGAKLKLYRMEQSGIGGPANDTCDEVLRHVEDFVAGVFEPSPKADPILWLQVKTELLQRAKFDADLTTSCPATP